MALDINGIKTAFKTVFDAANTTGAAYHLSTGLTATCGIIQKVLTRSINTKMWNADILPCVTVFTDRKKITPKDICKNQLTAKRYADVTFQVAGVLWNSNFTSVDVDAADNDIAQLMENIEEVLRRNDTLNGTVLSQMSTDVTYHDYARSEEEHYKVGIIDVTVRQLY